MHQGGDGANTMNTNPKPNAANDEPLTLEEFEWWIKEHPTWARRVLAELREEVSRKLREKTGPVPQAQLEEMAKGLEKQHFVFKMEDVRTKLTALEKLMKRPPGTMTAEDRLAQCQKLAEEITDDALELPEPNRTGFLKEFAPIREAISAKLVTEDCIRPAEL